MKRNWANGRTKLLNKLRQLPELADVASDQQPGGLQLSVDVDREKAARLNIHAASHRRHALRCLWAAAGLDHFYATEPISGHSGSRAEFSN